MKIGFVLDDTLDVSDGVQQAVLTIGRFLSGIGHEVHYLVSETLRTDITNIHSLAKYKKVTFNGNTVRVPLPVRNKVIKRFLQAQNFDVLHIQMPYSPFFAERIINNAPKKTKIIGTFHILPFSKTSAFGTRFLGLILKKSLKKFNKVIAVSEPAKEFCSKAFKVSPIVIPNPVQISRFKVASKKTNSKKRIVFLGRLVERKGSEELIRAYLKMLSDHASLSESSELVIAGKGELENKLKNIVKNHKSSSNINFYGYVEEKDKPNILANADIAVFPSKGGESFGIVLVEAMAAGARLVLAGDNPGYRSVMHKYPDLLIDPNDTKLFADKLFQLLQENKFNSDLSKNLSKEADQYDVSVVAKRLTDLYQS